MTVTALLNAYVILSNEESRFTTVRFRPNGWRAGAILAVDQPPQRGDRWVDLAGYALYPGLVNAHDHLEFNHYPRTKFRDVYSNAHHWSQEFTPRLTDEPFKSLRQRPLWERCQVGGSKNWRCGVRLVLHHNPPHPPLFQRHYPVRVVRRYGWSHSLYLTPESEIQRSYHQRRGKWAIHLAEGTDQGAADEYSRLVKLGVVGQDTLLIHGVGLTEADRVNAVSRGAGLVWCPSSNQFLVGATAVIHEFLLAGLVALGSDSMLTADGDLLDELRAAYRTGQATPRQLFHMVTDQAAKLIGEPAYGRIAVGYRPEFFITRLTPEIHADPYLALITLHADQIEALPD
jgi:cytosine/adenosine deaminase-related metal-dependent hydrolase